jgi:hypothetical protein
MGRYEPDLIGSGQGPVEGPCERGNEHSGSLKFWDILEQLID